jgi:PAS domain S-box-containing protein
MRCFPAPFAKEASFSNRLPFQHRRSLRGRSSIFKSTLLLICLSAVFLVAAGQGVAQEQTRRILIFTAYEPSYPAVNQLTQTITATIRNGSEGRVEFFYEFQENFRIPNSQYETEMVSYLKRKYEGQHLSLVLALGAPAIEFLLKHETALFPDVPKIYYFHDESEQTARNLWPHVTGVRANLEADRTLDIALTLLPDTQDVFVVGGSSSQDKFLLTEAQQQFRAYEERLRFTYLTDLTIDELKDKLAALPPKSVVVYVSFFVDKRGNAYSGPEGVSRVAPTANAPLFGISETYLGAGIVGGKLLDFQGLGKRTGELALQMMSPAKTEEITPQTIAGPTVFDWRELQRWKLDERKLPPGAVIRFRELTFWQQYKWYVLGAVAALLVQAALIAWLLFIRLRRRQAEIQRERSINELRLSEERFAKAFRSNPQPMSLTTIPDGLYIDVNESFLAMSGYTREEVIGHTSEELKVWKTPADRSAFLVELNKSGSVANYEMKFRCKDGSFRTLLVATEKFELAGKRCLLAASSDITEFMQTQQALRESEARFRNMADTAPVMIWISDESKGCTYFNEQWLNFTGRRIEQELGDGWSEGVYPADSENCLNIYKSSFDERRRFEIEYRLRRYDGQYRWILDCGTPRFSSDGMFLGYIGSCIDITERKQAEVALRKAHEELNELKNQLEAENIYLQQELQLDQTFGEMVGQSNAIKYVLFKANQVAPTDSTVLITGETGTGKELVARAIHGASLRKDRPLIKVNCAALSSTLIESELFGHEKGAFTGAMARKAGRFELANGGTIFLDEIGELPLEVQVKLLRVLQEGEFERVGGTKTIKADLRIIAATNKNLEAEVKKGEFREDLWYRLNVFPITVPPLRQRKEDIPALTEHFITKFARRSGKTITSVSPRVLQTLQAHSWPGNVRELANVIERAVIHTKGDVLQSVGALQHTTEEPGIPLKTIEEVERDCIMEALENTGWRIEGQHGAARILGLNPSTLRSRMLKLGIQRQRTVSS